MRQTSIVLAEDESDTRRIVSDFLKDNGFQVESFPDGTSAWNHLAEGAFPDILLLDVQLPGLSGLEIFEKVHLERPELPVILMTGYGDTDQAVQAIKRGAFYYFTKPLDLYLVSRILTELQEKIELRRRLEQLSGEEGELGLVGNNEQLRRARQRLRLVADLPTTVLIRGETGTGKELVARAVHRCGSRRHQPFVAINCAALPENLLESELFGFEKGAFTGASQNKPGRLELAHRGTLFLDEIGDLPMLLQAKLLRVIESREVERLGSVQGKKVDVRFVVATNQDLEAMVADGRFRRDLYFRLNAFEIQLPPLRRRLDDLPLLVRHFLRLLSSSCGRNLEAVDPDVLNLFQNYSWPGNVRELKNVLEAAAVVCTGSTILPDDLPSRPAWERGQSAAPESVLSEVERRTIEEALRHSVGNCSAAARRLGITRSQMRRKIRKYGLD